MIKVLAILLILAGIVLAGFVAFFDLDLSSQPQGLLRAIEYKEARSSNPNIAFLRMMHLYRNPILAYGAAFCVILAGGGLLVLDMRARREK